LAVLLVTVATTAQLPDERAHVLGRRLSESAAVLLQVLLAL
jgi:hypothetical protein